MAAFLLLFHLHITVLWQDGLFGWGDAGSVGGCGGWGGGGVVALGGAAVLVLARTRCLGAFWVRLLMGSGGGIYVVVEWRVAPTGCVG